MTMQFPIPERGCDHEYYRFYIVKSRNTWGKGVENSVDEGALPKIRTRGFCALK